MVVTQISQNLLCQVSAYAGFGENFDNNVCLLLEVLPKKIEDLSKVGYELGTIDKLRIDFLQGHLAVKSLSKVYFGHLYSSFSFEACSDHILLVECLASRTLPSKIFMLRIKFNISYSCQNVKTRSQNL